MKKTILHFSLVVLAALLLSLPALAQRKYDPTDYEWGTAPWRARYVIVGGKTFHAYVEGAQENNRKQDEKNRAGSRFFASLLDVYHPFKNTSQAKVYAFEYSKYDELGYQVLTFDRSGRVLTPNRAAGGLLVRERVGPYLNKEAVLVAGDGSPGNDWYRFAEWFEGFPSGAGGEFSPALCHWSLDARRYTLSRAERYTFPNARYNQKEVAEIMGLVGCREWTWQLNRPASVLGESGQPPRTDGLCSGNTPPETLHNGQKICAGLVEYTANDVQPYINVTTYINLGKADEQTFIGDFLGWARFDDPPRPVIGKHGKYWLCLHECPDGEAPGIIPDIKAWTTKRGWPMPKPVPFFPNSKFVGRNAH